MPPARLTHESLSLRHAYTDSERLEMANKLAQAYSTKAEIEEDSKRVKAQINDRMTTADGAIGKVSRDLIAGFEMREVRCALEYDFPNVGEVTYRDPDGNIAKQRAMTETERQMELPLPKSDQEVDRSIERSAENIKNFLPGKETKTDSNPDDPDGQCKECEKWFPASILKTTPEPDFHELCPGCWDKCVDEPKRQAAEVQPEAAPDAQGDAPATEAGPDSQAPPVEGKGAAKKGKKGASKKPDEEPPAKDEGPDLQF